LGSTLTFTENETTSIPIQQNTKSKLENCRGDDVPLIPNSSQSKSQNLDQQFIRVEVEDSGIGIHEDERQQLFQPFKQIQKRTGGTGLGLYSILKRMEALEGQCGVSDRRDRLSGSCFWFTFPYRPDESVSSIIDIPNVCMNDLKHDMPLNPSESNELQIEEYNQDQDVIVSRRGSDISKKYGRSMNQKILLVEDSVLIQKTASRALNKEGYIVDVAPNGVECLKLLRKANEEGEEYSFILMDIQMPVMDGIEATKRIRLLETQSQSQTTSDMSMMECGELISFRNQKRTQRRQIIIGISANSDSVTISDALVAGMNGFLSKPLSIIDLKECFDRFKTSN
jgi:CheY-like chemotaxis protein